MDKQKQIEEMAKSLCECCIENEEMTCSITPHPCVFAKSFAETIYKQGYRKIPKDAVVLTGTETEERLEDLLVEFDEMSFYPATLMPNAEECAREWKRKLIYAIGQLKKEMLKDCIESNKVARETYYKQGSKETAEKFAEMAKEGAFTDFMGEPIIRASKIDEICKEITEGKDDATSRSI